MTSQIYFGLFKNRQDVEMVMQEALPPKERATVEFAYRIGSWRTLGAQQFSEDDECKACHGEGEIIGGLACQVCGGTGKPKAQAAGQKFVENVLVFYSMDRKIYVYHGERNSDQSKWACSIHPKIRAAAHIESIPSRIAIGLMTDRWGVFLKEAYVRMLALEEMFGDFDHGVDRSKLPKILHAIPLVIDMMHKN